MQNANTKVRKKGGNLGTFSTFEGAEYISNVAAAISGGIESPLQIILQVFEIDILVSTIILNIFSWTIWFIKLSFCNTDDVVDVVNIQWDNP